VLPGCRIPGQKAQKGPEKKWFARKILLPILAEFCQKWPKRGRKFIFVNV
jgi:hypothetical protein